MNIRLGPRVRLAIGGRCDASCLRPFSRGESRRALALRRADLPWSINPTQIRSTAAPFDVVAHCLPGLFAAGLAGVRRNQADRFHHPGPLSVVVARPRLFPEMMLLKMRHFVDKRGLGLFGGTLTKVRRVKRELLGYLCPVPLFESAA